MCQRGHISGLCIYTDDDVPPGLAGKARSFYETVTYLVRIQHAECFFYRDAGVCAGCNAGYRQWGRNAGKYIYGADLAG